MKDEIKEILDSLNKIANVEYYPEDLLTYKECKQLLDYITNLEQENEKLKETVENLATFTVCGDRKQIKNTAQYKLEIAQARIDKAIEYIIENSEMYDEDLCTDVGFELRDLLNILTGGDEE